MNCRVLRFYLFLHGIAVMVTITFAAKSQTVFYVPGASNNFVDCDNKSATIYEVK